jgi:uncharacterized protein (DUF433 family)
MLAERRAPADILPNEHWRLQADVRERETRVRLVIAPEVVPLRVTADGVALVGKTRVPLATVIYHFNQGETPEQIVESFTTLNLGDTYAVIGYYLRHREAVEDYLRHQEQQAAAVRRENEARFPSTDLRERLLARRASGKS